jgi:hypothetical protein
MNLPISKIDTKLAEACRAVLLELDVRCAYEILVVTLEANGWHRVVIEKSANALEITPWVFNTIKGSYHGYYTDWCFEREVDAMWFKLRWSESIDTIRTWRDAL